MLVRTCPRCGGTMEESLGVSLASCLPANAPINGIAGRLRPGVWCRTCGEYGTLELLWAEYQRGSMEEGFDPQGPEEEE